MYNDKKEYTLKGTLEERTSTKTGQLYTCLVLKFGNYEKLVFLKTSEIELLKDRCK